MSQNTQGLTSQEWSDLVSPFLTGEAPTSAVVRLGRLGSDYGYAQWIGIAAALDHTGESVRQYEERTGINRNTVGRASWAGRLMLRAAAGKVPGLTMVRAMGYIANDATVGRASTVKDFLIAGTEYTEIPAGKDLSDLIVAAHKRLVSDNAAVKAEAKAKAEADKVAREEEKAKRAQEKADQEQAVKETTPRDLLNSVANVLSGFYKADPATLDDADLLLYLAIINRAGRFVRQHAQAFDGAVSRDKARRDAERASKGSTAGGNPVGGEPQHSTATPTQEVTAAA